MSVWEQISTTLVEEFSDLPDAIQVTRITLRLSLAALLGGILGYEREHKGKSAGLRTHMLVALGSALFVLIPQQSGESKADLSRIIQGLVAGIGFLGAGSIIKGKGETEVKGLTTAAGIWLTAAIGMAAGMGRESSAVLSTVLALFILEMVPKLSLLGQRQFQLWMGKPIAPNETVPAGSETAAQSGKDRDTPAGGTN